MGGNVFILKAMCRVPGCYFLMNEKYIDNMKLYRISGTVVLGVALLFWSDFSAKSDTGYSFDGFSYTGKSLDISEHTSNARATDWHPDGSELFVVGRRSVNVANYSLSEPWDIESAGFSIELNLSDDLGRLPLRSVAHGLFIREDGEKLWVFNRTEIYGYKMDEAWDISTASKSQYKSLSDFVSRGHDFDFHPDGSRLFIDDRNKSAVFQLELSEPWDVTTAELVYTLDISDQEEAVRGLEIIDDGRIMLLMDTDRGEVLKYHLQEPYELQSAEYGNAFDVSEQTVDPRGLSVSTSMDAFYVTGRDNEKVYKYRK